MVHELALCKTNNCKASVNFTIKVFYSFFLSFFLFLPPPLFKSVFTPLCVSSCVSPTLPFSHILSLPLQRSLSLLSSEILSVDHLFCLWLWIRHHGGTEGPGSTVSSLSVPAGSRLDCKRTDRTQQLRDQPHSPRATCGGQKTRYKLKAVVMFFYALVYTNVSTGFNYAKMLIGT